MVVKTKTNELLFKKTAPPKVAGHRQASIKQDSYGLFRESDTSDLYILNVLKIERKSTCLQIDVIMRSHQGVMNGITYMLTPTNLEDLDGIRFMLLEPTISAQLQGYVFTYNFTTILQAISSKYKFKVTRYTDTMDEQYLSLHNAKPSKYIVSEEGILGFNSLMADGTMYAITLGQSIIGQIYIQALKLEATRRKQMLNLFNNRTGTSGKSFNVRVLEREISMPIKLTLFKTPLSFEEYEED